MEAHKSEVLSINLSSADFLQSEPDSEEAWELRDRLKEMNSRWDRLGSSLEDWREELQRALMQCQVLKITIKTVARSFVSPPPVQNIYLNISVCGVQLHQSVNAKL